MSRTRRQGPSSAASSGGDRGAPRRSQIGGDQVEGRHAVRALLTARTRRTRTLFVSGDGVDDLAALARDAGVSVRKVGPDQLADLAGSAAPQGVVALADALPEAKLDDCVAHQRAFLVVLDGVTDPQNLGAVLRTANAAGATAVVVPRHRSARVTPVVTKAAAGAIEHVPIVSVAGVPAALERARRAEVWTVGLAGDGDTDIDALPVADRPLALVLGSEGRGIARLTRERCDVVARIAMHGQVASLNVAAAAAVACFTVARLRAG